MTQILSHTSKAPQPRQTNPNGFLGQLWPAVAMTLIIALACGILYPLLVWGVAQLAFPHQANGSLVDKNGQRTTDDSAAVGSALLGQAFGAPQYFHPRPSYTNSGSVAYDASNSGATNFGPLSDQLLNGLIKVDTSAASQPATQTAGTQVATSQPATQPAKTLAFDGLRLRTLHYARENNIAFKLYTVRTNHNSDGTTTQITTEVPLANYLDKDGNLNDLALVDAFPHPSDADTKAPLIASAFATAIPADAVTASASGLDPHISPANANLQAARVAEARHMTPAEVAAYVSKYTDQPSLGILGEPGVNVLLLNLALDHDHPLPSPATTSTPATSPH